MKERRPCPCGEWDCKTIAELDEILQAELRKEHPDEGVVLPVLRAIEKKETETSMEQASETFETFGQLSKHDQHTKPSKSRRGWVAGIAAAAAAILLVIMTIPNTVGAESIMEVLFRWTGSVFEFFDPDNAQSTPKPDDGFSSNNPGLQQLYEQLTELGVSKAVVPTWLPEGYELSDLNVSSTHGGSKVHCQFVRGATAILVTYRISMDIVAKVEKEESVFELFDVEGVPHIIVENDGNFSVTWTVDGVACLLSANVAKDELYSILKSIYRSELSQ